LIMLMLIEAVSRNSGRIKVGRLLVDLKYAYNELFHMLHPHALMSIRLGETRVKRIFSALYSFTRSLPGSLVCTLSLAGHGLIQRPRVDLTVVASASPPAWAVWVRVSAS